MEILQSEFSTRAELIAYVQNISPHAVGGASPILGGHQEAQAKLQHIDPINYGNTRNYGKGKITRISPFVHHGIVSLNHIRNHALEKCNQPEQITKFIQELAWRDFWQRVADKHPDWLWEDVEEYKTGFSKEDYSDQLSQDILEARTGTACLDAFIQELLTTGYLHNHARMYLASYVVHFRKVKWQAGAAWFLSHLLDGDVASNNLSWQWIASTFSNKPYIFTLENVAKYFADLVDTSPENNSILDTSYPELAQRLFPRLD